MTGNVLQIGSWYNSGIQNQAELPANKFLQDGFFENYFYTKLDKNQGVSHKFEDTESRSKNP